MLGRIVAEGVEVNGDDGVVGADEVLAGDVEGLVSHALGAEVELDGAELALAVAVAGVAVAGEAHGHGALGGEGDEAEAVGDELVVEDGGVDLDLDEVDGDDGDLGDHDAAKGVGDAGVRVAELELEVIVLHFPYLHLREPLVRRAFHRRQRRQLELCTEKSQSKCLLFGVLNKREEVGSCRPNLKTPRRFDTRKCGKSLPLC